MKVEHLTKEFAIKSNTFGAKPLILHALMMFPWISMRGKPWGLSGNPAVGNLPSGGP